MGASFRKEFPDWAFGEKKLSFSSPLVFGVLNVTPDSFSDGGMFTSEEKAFGQARKMLSEGAHAIDVGGESSRPGAAPVSSDEELSRVLPVIKRLNRAGAVVSIDTCKPRVAEECLREGAVIINDITGFREKRMVKLAGDSGAGAVVVHMKGEPRTMQDNPLYSDLVGEVNRFFGDRARALRAAGVGKIMLDPGIGFGKTVSHNTELLSRLCEFRAHGLPLMVGVSRKSFIGRISGAEVGARLPGTIAANALALANGASAFRVHDVAENLQALKVAREIVPGSCSDRVLVRGLECSASIGVTGAERSKKQRLVVDVEMLCDLHLPASSGKLADTANYSEVVSETRRVVEGKEFVLLETMAKEVSEALKKRFRAIEVVVRIGKSSVAKKNRAGFIGVEFLG